MTTRILSVVVLLLGTVQAGPRPAPPRTFDAVVALETTSEDSANVSMDDLDGDGDLDIVLARGGIRRFSTASS